MKKIPSWVHSLQFLKLFKDICAAVVIIKLLYCGCSIITILIPGRGAAAEAEGAGGEGAEGG